MNNTLVNIHTVEQLLDVMKDLLHNSLTQELNREIINDLNKASQLQAQLTVISKRIRNMAAKGVLTTNSFVHRPYWITTSMIKYVEDLISNEWVSRKSRLSFIKTDLKLTTDKANELITYYDLFANG